ncbi:MAG: DAK2 domain-containing protein [Firmicutes bacterium]|nr:DAK2 domain-containing protein [Candidatus Fermentithermobacillaceae bacterium]
MAHSVLDGDVFRSLVLSASSYLGARKKEVDSLNVFPVPEGDTGTNMYLTLSSAAQAISDRQGLTLGEASEMASHGALMGARGNSGVILSQILRGIATCFSGRDSVSASEICRAFDQAVATAYKAVMKPVEGTILTVLRGLRDGASSTASSRDLSVILDSGLREAKAVLERTPEMLPVLKQAGVVDAGGKGLVFIIEGFLEGLTSEGVREIAVGENQVGFPKPQKEGFRVEELETADIRFPYDTQLLVALRDSSPSLLRADLTPLGDSLLVVGSEDLARVHIHTDRPGDVLTVCLKHGTLSNVTIDNMIEQSEAMARSASEGGSAATVAMDETRRAVNQSGTGSFLMPSVSSAAQEERVKDVGIVSVATGPGLKDIMKSLGSDLVIDGGATMNPSTAELAAAVKTVAAKKIIFFPNNGNIFLAAKQAKKLTGRNMYIVPSKTIPQGISGLLSLNLNEDMGQNLKRASKALKRVKTGEVTYAARSGKFGRHVMNQGDILGLIEGKVEHVGQDPTAALREIVSRMVKKNDEIVTVYWGLDVSQETAERAREELEDLLGDSVEIEFHNGGQPLYYYIVSVE